MITSEKRIQSFTIVMLVFISLFAGFLMGTAQTERSCRELINDHYSIKI